MDSHANNKTTKLFVAAFDFGSTYSGYAFSFKDDFFNKNKKIQTANWTGGTLISLKAPTVLLLDSGAEFIAFGFEAEDEYADLVAEEKHKDFYFFDQFKMILYEESRFGRTTCLKDIHGKPLQAIKVFAHCIKHLKDHLMTEINKQKLGVNESDGHFVMTVPAIWSDKAKMFMREAAIKAGIKNDSLTIALEPEAASIYCQHLPIDHHQNLQSTNFGNVKKGTEFLVCDLGGGTTDIIAHRKCEDQTLQEMCPASGGPWAGQSINKAFLKCLTDMFGSELIETFKKDFMEDFFELIRKFETHKRAYNNEKAHVFITIPLALVELVKKEKRSMDTAIKQSTYANDVSFGQGKLQLSAELFSGFFKETTSKIVYHLEEMFQQREMRDISTILLVGGFSECNILQHEVKTKFSDKRVIVPQESGLCVLRGAVYFGFLPDAVSRRTTRHTYGIQSWPDFNPSVYHQSKKVSIGKSDHCKDVFFPFVRKGEHIKPGDVKRHVFRTLHTGEEKHCCAIYISEKENPKYVDDDSCRVLGILEIPLPKRGKDKQIEIEETMMFGETELRFVVRDSITHEPNDIKIDLLSVDDPDSGQDKMAIVTTSHKST